MTTACPQKITTGHHFADQHLPQANTVSAIPLVSLIFFTDTSITNTTNQSNLIETLTNLTMIMSTNCVTVASLTNTLAHLSTKLDLHKPSLSLPCPTRQFWSSNLMTRHPAPLLEVTEAVEVVQVVVVEILLGVASISSSPPVQPATAECVDINILICLFSVLLQRTSIKLEQYK